MTRQPDEDYDVIVHQCRQRDERDLWTIWLGGDKQGERDTRQAAIQPANDVAAVRDPYTPRLFGLASVQFSLPITAT